MSDTARLFNLDVVRVTADELIDRLTMPSAEVTARSKIISYLNAHTVNLAGRDSGFRKLLQGFDLLYADGMSVVRASRKLGDPLPERVSAADFFERFAWASAARGRRLAMVGSREATVRQAAATLRARIPNLEICFVHHGHFVSGSAEEERLLSNLAGAMPDILLVGMGSPRQERWAAGHASRIAVPVVWCVGALFEYFAERRRAPVWMREAGLEWLYRLALEPRRLGPRYLLGNAEFLWRVWLEQRQGR